MPTTAEPPPDARFPPKKTCAVAALRSENQQAASYRSTKPIRALPSTSSKSTSAESMSGTMRNPDCERRGSPPVGALEYVRNWQGQGTPNLRPLPSECKKTLFHHLIIVSNIMKCNRCYCITEGGFASLGTPFCPKIVPKHGLCLPGKVLTCGIETTSPNVVRSVRPWLGCVDKRGSQIAA